jgi:hypothetical protein
MSITERYRRFPGNVLRIVTRYPLLGVTATTIVSRCDGYPTIGTREQWPNRSRGRFSSPPNPLPMLFIEDLAGVLRTSRSTIARRRRAGTFPIPELPGIDRRTHGVELFQGKICRLVSS